MQRRPTCYISDDDVESTAMSSDQSSVSGDHHHEGYETDSNYCDSSKSSDEESVGDPDVQVDSCESDNSPHDHEPLTLPLSDGSNKYSFRGSGGVFLLVLYTFHHQ